MGMLDSRATASVRNLARPGAMGCSAIGKTYYECRMLNAECRMGLAALLSAFCILHSAFGQFQPALPGYEFSFPRDHGTHDEYRTEWWYYTGHLRTDDGRAYGFELTFFRVGISREPATTRWDLRNLSLAHFAITDVDRRDFRYYEKLNRASPFTASAAAGRLDVFNEAWRATTLPDGAWQRRRGALTSSTKHGARRRCPTARGASPRRAAATPSTSCSTRASRRRFTARTASA